MMLIKTMASLLKQCKIVKVKYANALQPYDHQHYGNIPYYTTYDIFMNILPGEYLIINFQHGAHISSLGGS